MVLGKNKLKLQHSGQTDYCLEDIYKAYPSKHIICKEFRMKFNYFGIPLLYFSRLYIRGPEANSRNKSI